MYQRYHLSHLDALKIVAAIQAELEKQGKSAAIAVTDTQGELLAFLRIDGCKLPSIAIAINKAFTAAREQKESKIIGDSSRKNEFPMTNYGDLRYNAWGGVSPSFTRVKRSAQLVLVVCLKPKIWNWPKWVRGCSKKLIKDRGC